MLTFASMVILSLIITGIMISGFKRVLISNIESTTLSVTKESSQHISNLLDNYMASISALTYSEEIKSMDWEIQRKFIDDITNPFFRGITIIDLDGVGRNEDQTTYLGDRDYYKKALQGDNNISDIIYSRFINKSVIVFAAPIKKNNEVVGVITGRIYADDLAKVIKEKNLEGLGFSYILNIKGDFVTHYDESLLHPFYNIFNYKADEQTSFIDFYQNSIKSCEGFGRYENDNKILLMAYYKIEGTNWILYSGASEEDLYKELRDVVQLYTVLAAIFTASCLFVAYLVADSVTRPLIRLSKTISKIRHGNFKVRSKIKRSDEIGDLASGFNKLMDEVDVLTFTDDITMIPNINALKNHLKYATDDGRKILMLIELKDYYKTNEIYGSEACDILSKDFAERIQYYIKDSEKIFKGRLDNFFVVLDYGMPMTIMNHATMIADQLSKPFYIGHHNISLQFHMGLIEYSPFEISVSELISNVNHACLDARKENKLIKWYNPVTHKLGKEQAQIEVELLEAIKRKDFHLNFQPIINLEKDQIFDVEALIRWLHPKLGFVSPELFIGMAETMGKIDLIDFWVVEEVCKQIKAWDYKLHVSINISSNTFEDPDFVEKIMHLLNHHKVNPSLLKIELTERVILHDLDNNIQKMDKLRQLGFKIALDDFGIGYSSLSYLVQLPVDIVKIDRSFIMKMHEKAEAKSIVNAIIGMCHEIGLQVVAEGIETKEDLIHLKERACDLGQGYYFDKALTAEKIKEKYIQ